MILINDLGYFWGGVPLEEADQKNMKRLMDTYLMMEVRTREERKIIFDNFWKFLASLLSILLLMTCSL